MKKYNWLLLCCLSLIACKQSAPAPSTPPPVAVEEKVAPAPADPLCLGEITSGTPQTFVINHVTWELNGSTLTQKSPATADALVVGVVSDIKEDAPETVANLKKINDLFRHDKVNMIIVTGDTGETAKQIEGAISVLAEVGVPVLNIIGNREGRTAYKQAMESLQAKHSNIFNLVNIRRVDTPWVDFVTMPGYYNASYLHAADGCAYTTPQVEALGAVISAANSPVVMISHGGPKQSGPQGIDRTADGENVGDPALAKVMTQYNVPFGIFSNIHEAGGKATDASGANVLPPSVPQSSLYLNAGPADSVRWLMNDGTESLGMAGVVVFKEGKASYTIHRLNTGKKQLVRR